MLPVDGNKIVQSIKSIHWNIFWNEINSSPSLRQANDKKEGHYLLIFIPEAALF